MKALVQLPETLRREQNTAICSLAENINKAESCEHALRNVVGSTPFYFFSLDLSGVVTTGFGSGADFADFESAILVGRSLQEIRNDVPELETIIPQLISDKSGVVSVHLSDKEFKIWHSPLGDRKGKKNGHVGIVVKASEHAQVEEKGLEDPAMLHHLMMLHERDRELIAYEIHDGMIQDVTAAQMSLSTLLDHDEMLSPESRGKILQASSLISKAVDEARRLIAGLRLPILEERGLFSAISMLIEEVQGDQLKIEFIPQVSFERLDPQVESTIYRIVQQALNNIKRHSQAEKAQIRFTQQGDWLHLEIEDWGIGFALTSVGDDRFGLQGIRQRARLMRGRAVIDSAPGKGTRIIVDLPAAYTLT
ncbi:MAG: sensor histidine kinase [Thermoguttaceae bacterium]